MMGLLDLGLRGQSQVPLLAWIERLRRVWLPHHRCNVLAMVKVRGVALLVAMTSCGQEMDDLKDSYDIWMVKSIKTTDTKLMIL